MNFTEAESRYRTLKILRDSGQILSAEFTSRVHELRLQDIGGVWWQIREQDGRWLRWNGLAWEPTKLVLVSTLQYSMP